jgi:hypothetical protein
MKKNIKRPIIGEFKCDKCQRIFYRKWVKSLKNWTKVNEVNYWTEGKIWDNYKILCRFCLNDWAEKAQKDFTSMVPKNKRGIFYNYRHLGLFDKGKEMYKN